MSAFDFAIVLILVLLSGLFSGLTLGLMSLNVYELRRKSKLNNKSAKKLYPIRKLGNLLLCTLLLGNVLVNSVLAVFLGSITVGVVAVILSTGLITIFGEIVPQAVISRYAMSFGAKTTWLVYFFIIILYPATKPISWALDKVLGRELPNAYTKKELALILDEQGKHKKSNVLKYEAEMAAHSLAINETMVFEVMTPWRNVFKVDTSDSLTQDFLEKVQKTGHSRIPVFDKKEKKVKGILYVKDLVSSFADPQVNAGSLVRRNATIVHAEDKLGKVLRLFKTRKKHLFIVENDHKKIVGIVTLEDVIEEITGEIVDEHDRFVDMRIGR